MCFMSSGIMQVTMPDPQRRTCRCRCRAWSSWSISLNYKLKTKHISRTQTRQWLKNEILQELPCLTFSFRQWSRQCFFILTWLSYKTYLNCPFHSRSFAPWMCGPIFFTSFRVVKTWWLPSVFLPHGLHTWQFLSIFLSFSHCLKCWVVFLCLLVTPSMDICVACIWSMGIYALFWVCSSRKLIN